MVRLDLTDGLSPYLLRLRFKSWAKLWTVGNIRLVSMKQALAQEKLNIRLGAVARNVPLPGQLKPRLLRKVGYLRREAAVGAHARHSYPAPEDRPDCFLVESYNPNARAIGLTLTVRPATGGDRSFQTLISLSPGYTRARVPFADICAAIDTSRAFEVELVPNDSEDMVLYFGLIDFVKERSEGRINHSTESADKKWKCIVWDLDNTLWDGTLIEDGSSGVRVRQDVVDIIRTMDQRGILQSIASKNGHDDAMALLKSHGIDQYFLYPQIHWRPKSESIAAIAKSLNIGLDTMAFVDDQRFEREEVKASLPAVEVVDARDYRGILARRECDVPVTSASITRRLLYRDEERRHVAMNAYSGGYLEFLKHCDMRLQIQPLNDGNLKRVYELAQRTNQLNFSGTRYEYDRLKEIMHEATLETYVVECRDRFGSYGIIGFAVVDAVAPRLLDLMFSCRIQGKRVEHAVLSFLLKRFAGVTGRPFLATYRRTSTNATAGRVFSDIGFECIEESEGVATLVFTSDHKIPDDQLIEIAASQAIGSAVCEARR